MSKSAKIILLALGTVLLIWGITILSDSKNTQTATSTPDNTQSATVPEGWEAYENSNFAFTFSRPPEAEVSTEAGRVKLQVLGDSNEPNTEVTDGITGYISTKEKSGQDLQTVADTVFSDREAASQEVITDPQEKDFAGKSGFSFELRNQLGSVTTYHVLPADSNQVFVISYTANGENSQGYVQTMEQIVSSLSYESNESDSTDEDKSETNSDENSTDESEQSLAQACQQAGGEWLDEYSECEGVQEAWCTQRGGSYNNCASACRHNPDAQMCTQQCVFVCSF